MMNWFLNFYFGEGPGIDKNAPKPKGLKLLGTCSRANGGRC